MNCEHPHRAQEFYAVFAPMLIADIALLAAIGVWGLLRGSVPEALDAGQGTRRTVST